jgi:hypothetical protein
MPPVKDFDTGTETEKDDVPNPSCAVADADNGLGFSQATTASFCPVMAGKGSRISETRPIAVVRELDFDLTACFLD